MDKEEPQSFKKIYDTLFSKDPLTKGEIILIIVIIIFTITVIYMSYRTTCELDCSMCENLAQTIKQRGFGG